MIPIRFRLSEDEKIQYIDKVLKIIGDSESCGFSDNIKKLLEKMKKNGYKKVNALELKAKKYIIEYPTQNYLCMWLVLSSEEIDSIKKYIYINYIKNDLDNINRYMLTKGKREVSSYSALRERRKLKYKKNSAIKKFLKQDIVYDEIYSWFSDLKDIYTEKFSKGGHNSWIIEKTQIRVCPYCNLAYTYNRGSSTVAQLDHFFSKAEYPMFALCFYNLIPSCSACNHIKLDKQDEMISPYKDNAFENFKISWEYNSENEDGDNNLINLENDIKITLKPSCIGEKNNIDSMKIEDAYNQHRDYAAEIIKKVRIFSNKDSQKLIVAMGKKAGIKINEIERFYFGNYVDEKQLEKRILSKLTRDFYLEYLNLKK